MDEPVENNQVNTFVVEEPAEPAMNTEQTYSPDSTINQEVSAPVTPATIRFLGQTISFIASNGSASAPAVGAGTWTGTGAVNDQMPTHFIGHNPGDFSGVMNITVGTPITIVDYNGNSKTYVVIEVLDVLDNGINANNPSDNTWERVIEAGGERISLQTCITDIVNRIVLAS